MNLIKIYTQNKPINYQPNDITVNTLLDKYLIKELNSDFKIESISLNNIKQIIINPYCLKT